MYKTNYFFSGWIENLGVVPLFSLACFLFAPAFLAFKFLLHLVCVVFEAISISLSCLFNYNYRGIYLSLLLLLVKNFIPTAQSASNLNIQNHVTKDIFLSRGEQLEIKVGPLTSFSVGNPEVIKYKHRISKQSLLIKGKSLGFSDIVIWKSKTKKLTYNFYVTSKREQLTTMDIAQSLKQTSLNVKIHGRYIHITGTLLSLADYTILKKLQTKKNEHLIFNVKLSKALRNKIIAKIYTSLYTQGIEHVSCRNIETQIICHYQENTSGAPILKELESKYFVIFKNTKHQKLSKNFTLQFKILVLNNYSALTKTFGLNKFETSLQELIKHNKSAASSSNILFQDQNSSAELIAQPVITMTIDGPFNLQLGGDIPFQTNKDENSTIEWKFAGLKVNGKLSLKYNSYFLKYKSMFTSPIDGSLSGPKGNSTIFLKLNKPQQLFSIDLKEISSNKSSIPVLSKVPLLKHLFQEDIDHQGERKVIGFIELKEKVDEL